MRLLNYFLQSTAIPMSARMTVLTENYVFLELMHVNRNNSGFSIRTATFNQYELDFIVFNKSKCHDEYVKRIGIEVKTTDGDVKSAKAFKRASLIDEYYKICQVSGENNILLWDLYKIEW